MRAGKRVLAVVLAAALSATAWLPMAQAANPGVGNFKTVRTYEAGRFRDVPKGAWYEENVKTAYELDLIQGASKDTFHSEGTMTVASALALACRIHSIYQTGEASFTQGDPWYQVYVDYALKNKIITAGQFTNYTANATRRQFAAILAKALPQSALAKKNTIDDGAIPDVAKGSPYYDEIYCLYRAGILTGNDTKGTFTPEATIQRSAAAAIISRMALPSLRQSMTLKTVAVTRVSLNETSKVLEKGKTFTLSATVQPSNATNRTVTWSSSNTAVATVSDKGVVTGVKKGTATITAKAHNGVKATCTVQVEDKIVPVSSIYVSPSSTYLDINETKQLSCAFYPSDATDRSVTWSSSNTAVATVSSSGAVTARKEGNATITARSANGKTDTCYVTVYPPVEVTSVSVYPSAASMKAGETKTLDCTVRPYNAADQSVTWSSSDTSVATVSSSGVVTAKSAGTATITAKAHNGKYDTCRITVKGSVTPTFSVPKMNYNYGPMTVTSYYSSGKVQYINKLTRLEFTEIGSLSDETTTYLTAMVQGTSTSDKMYVKINLYDSSNRLLDSDTIAETVTANQDFAIDHTVHFSNTALSKASRIEFVSFSNNVAKPGTDDGGQTPGGDGDYEMYYGYDIPTFDQFTGSSRTTMSEKENTASYMYASATQSEVNAYVAALKACGFQEGASIGTLKWFTKGTSGESDFMEVRLSTTSSPYGELSAGVIISRIKPANEWENGGSSGGGSGSGSGSSDYDLYYGYDIPTFDQFTSSSRSTLKEEENVAGYLYSSAKQSEVDAYCAALKDYGFKAGVSIGAMQFFSKGTSGDPDYMEVRLSTTSSPYGELAVNMVISRIKPSNEW